MKVSIGKEIKASSEPLFELSNPIHSVIVTSI